ncbi:YeeE/YedE thiosulfate transporter family protein [Salipiger mucosus]|uniref:Lipocalin-related protein and Bos/Can/Equ allergen n=1 Tax=Salipiger mucosus DSM 16094 TaxID=1123237 RepID=S9RPU8_9RHOB|nr:YeeE/YedE thiosulfate transporter family protein [Salipiger mucosus]EPX76034.1 Lipocalin-related protein and Bos/Can/Equ allergen [Salipiger mucosus DSM 16094]
MTLDWKLGGILLGAVFFAAVLLVKPIGVSTQFVILDGIVADAVSPDFITQTDEGWTSTNAYMAKSSGKYAASAAGPLNYGFVFVLAMAVGAFLSSMLRGGVPLAERRAPEIWRANFGDTPWRRYAVAFAGGFVVLYGARLAGGCTSGHMMSGMMQTALSGYIFAAGAFLAAVPTAMLIYKEG